MSRRKTVGYLVRRTSLHNPNLMYPEIYVYPKEYLQADQKTWGLRAEAYIWSPSKPGMANDAADNWKGAKAVPVYRSHKGAIEDATAEKIAKWLGANYDSFSSGKTLANAIDQGVWRMRV